jgi:hypothetical protein
MLFFFTGCKEKEVTITKNYVINPYWDKIDNSFDVIRMKLKNSNNIDVKNTSSSEVLRELEEDTSFVYRASVKYNGEDYSKRKVYFNEDNDFLWWGDLHNSSSTKKVLGKLQKNTWYFLAGLGKEKTLYYVFVDSLDNLHTFRVPASAWTNY